MDCLLFPHSFFPSRFHRSSPTPQIPTFTKQNGRFWNSTSWKIKVSREKFDESPLRENENDFQTPKANDFFVSDAEGDPDCPTEGYSSIERALNALHQGKFVIVVDDENGDNEGNLIMAASMTSPRDIAFLVKHGSGIVSVGMLEKDLERLKLPLMSPETEDEDSSAPTFTITVVTFSNSNRKS